MGIGDQFVLRAAFVLFVLFLSSTAIGATYHLNPDGSGDYPTIQAAIDASSNGDVIELADGVFTGVGNRDLDYHGKLICVRSASGNPEHCILDCEGQGRGFYFHSGEDLSARVEGLTVRNGDVYSGSPYGDLYTVFGGAVLFDTASASIERCRFVGNNAVIGGAVSFHERSVAIIQDCEFSDNTAVLAGGLYVDASWLDMYHCEIRRSISWGAGGGICTYDSDLVLIDVFFSKNVTTEEGGGLFTNFTPLLAVDCVFENNSADQSGGGARLGNGQESTILINCTLRGNTSKELGGGIYIFHDHGSVDFIGCAITQNTARSGGGVGMVSESLPVIHDCTIMNNYAEQEGGGIYVLPSE